MKANLNEFFPLNDVLSIKQNVVTIQYCKTIREQNEIEHANSSSIPTYEETILYFENVIIFRECFQKIVLFVFVQTHF